MASCKRQTCQEFVCGTAVCVWTTWFDFNCIEAHRAANLHPINKTTVKSLCQCCDNNNTTTPPIQSTALNWGVVVLSLVKCRCNKDIRKYFFSHRVVSKWNMLDNDSVMAKTVNGLKTKLERERAKKMGMFLDWCLLDLEAVTEFRSGHPASILQVQLPQNLSLGREPPPWHELTV